MEKDEIIRLLSDEAGEKELFDRADAVRKKYVDDEIHLRGLIEFSNICRNNCLYCGIRRGNDKAARYHMPEEEIIETARRAADMGFKTIVLQSGEDMFYTRERMSRIIAAIKKFEEDSKTTLDEYINKIYSETDDPESFVDKEGNQLSEDEAKKEMRDALVKDRSLRLARNAARDFINLYFNKENITEEEFKNIATTNGLTVKLSEPFAVTDTPAELDITFSDVQRVFALSETNLYTPPIMGTNNVYAFFFSKKIEAYNPEYKNIQDKVLESYKESEAASKARLKARNFQQSLTNALANGEKTFEQLAQEANAKHITLPVFSIYATGLYS